VEYYEGYYPGQYTGVGFFPDQFLNQVMAGVEKDAVLSSKKGTEDNRRAHFLYDAFYLFFLSFVLTTRAQLARL
jgi:hypothetical protein